MGMTWCALAGSFVGSVQDFDTRHPENGLFSSPPAGPAFALHLATPFAQNPPNCLHPPQEICVRVPMLLITVLALEAVVTAQTESTWWDLDSLTTDRPAPRRDAAVAANYSTGEIVLFGGTNGLTFFNDTWVLLAIQLIVSSRVLRPGSGTGSTGPDQGLRA